MATTAQAEAGQLRLAELLAALSLVTDLGMGHPPEEAMRTCLLATALSRRLGHDESVVADVYWTALLMHVGCTAYAHEQSAFFGGDDIAVNDLGSRTDFGDSGEALQFLLDLTRGMGAARRVRTVVLGAVAGQRFGQRVAVATCEVAAGMTRRLGLGPSVQRGLAELFERWDGRGEPRKLGGDAIALPARVAQLAAQVTVYLRLGGMDAAVAMTRRRAGAALDPALADAFVRDAAGLLQDAATADPAAAVLAAEPAPARWVPDAHLDDVARAFADAVDLKCPFTLGHSVGVARLAEAAAAALGLELADRVMLRRAALFHDLGRVCVRGGIWDKPGPLTGSEWEQVRLHPYHTERILARSSVLAPLARTAGLHHERLDGSGYYRQAVASGLPVTARVLAAADAFQAMTQNRPHRPALAATAAAAALAAEADAGRLDRAAVDAVLAAAGRAPPHARPRPYGGLTERELEVLRLLARGHTNRQMARQLYITSHTVGRHVEHIYQKLGVSSRAAAAMFAAENALL
jgi:HD-GYP domain-containing protein (c-di-GMP phosphodiesterase class II)